MTAAIAGAGARGWLRAGTEAALVAILGLACWTIFSSPAHAPPWDGRTHGYAYSTGERDAESIKRDIRLLSRYTRRVRTYSAEDLRAMDAIANARIEVAAGVWLNEDLASNERELAAVAHASRKYANITSAVIGNETLLRESLTPQQVIDYLDRARAQLAMPVSIAEPVHVWLDNPQLVDHVDFLTVHLLPYWDGVPMEQGVDHVFARLAMLQARFPGKRIVIGEVGWPSAGQAVSDATASPPDQAVFVRDFVHRARDMGWDYYLMEAFDQPWKAQREGLVGAYWGVFDAHGERKFAWTGPIRGDPNWHIKALTASGLAFLPMLVFALRFQSLRPWGRWLFLALLQASAALAVWSSTLPLRFYPAWQDWALLAMVLSAQLLAGAGLLVAGLEFVETLARDGWRRRGVPCPAPPGAVPKVSVHLPCHNEPPELVIQALDSLAQLDYPDYEVLVIDNNTTDEAIWRPLQAKCLRLGERFRFFHLEQWPGFKAGALNYALSQTAPCTDIVALVDSDYVVKPDWLKDLAGHFADPSIGIVQAPQAHRDFAHDLFRRMCNWEFESFFRIGMHHRHEHDAIIVHGTMVMIRRALLQRLGWAEWCICEDAELGLRVQQSGYQAVYVDRPYGHGVTPSDFGAYKAQRFRWAFGAMQILRHHGRWLLRTGRLSFGQRYHYLTGWLPWIVDAGHLVFSVCAIALSLGQAFGIGWDALPYQLFAIPIAAMLGSKLLLGLILHRSRVRCSWNDTLAVLVANLALTHTIGRAVLRSIFSRRYPFRRTAKKTAGSDTRVPGRAVIEEFVLFVALWLCVLVLLAGPAADDPLTHFWAAVLALQSLPYAAALYCEWLSTRERKQLVPAR